MPGWKDAFWNNVFPYSRITKSWQPAYRCTFSESLKQKSHLFGASLETAAQTPTFHLHRSIILLSNCSWQDFSPQLKIRGKYGLTQTVGPQGADSLKGLCTAYIWFPHRFVFVFEHLTSTQVKPFLFEHGLNANVVLMKVVLMMNLNI